MSQLDRARLRAGLPVLWRSLTEVQVGTDPRWAVVLADLSPAAARALQGVGPAAGGRRDLRATLDREEVSAAEAAAVIAHLLGAGLALDGPDRPLDGLDEAAWSLVEEDGAGDRVVRTRARRRVEVRGLDRLGTAVAVQLAAAGIGTVLPVDGAAVTADDVLPGGLTPEDVGRSREAAVRDLLGRGAPAPRTRRSGRAPDLVVLIEHGAADPVHYRTLAAENQPHLSILVREASVLLGPLVVPGESSCLRCVDLHRAEHDERWPALAAQLVGHESRTGLEAILVGTAAALAAAQVVAHLDGRPTSVTDGGLEVRLPELLPRRTTWPPHPGCGCGGLGSVAVESGDGAA